MKNCAGTRWWRAGIGAACLALVWTQAAQAQVKLEYKFPEGKKLTHKSTVKTKQVLTLGGMEIETSTEQVAVSSQTNGKRRDDSNIPVEEKSESLHLELSLPGGISLTFDSSNPDAKIDNPALAFLGEALKLASETSYTVVVDAHNKVKAVEGNEKIVEKAEKLSPQARDLIQGRMEADKLKQRFEQEHGNLPEVLARPGESWERTETLDISGGQVLSFKKQYEYLGTEMKGDKTLDKIKTRVTEVELKQEPGANSPFKIVKSNTKVESSEAIMLFDREEGHVVSLKGKLHIKGDMMTYSINDMEIPGALDLTIESNTELQPAAK
jgi:Family of unknown function (DUF6263)